MLPSFRSLTAPQRPTRLLQPRRPTLRFWCLTPKGERDWVWLDLGGLIYLGGAYLLCLAFYVWYITMHSYYFHALNYISVIVIFMWDVWYLCDMWHVCSLLWSLYMSCHFIMLIWFASALYSDSNELYFLYSCLFHIYLVHHVGLGHISLPNTFVLVDKSLYEPSISKTSLFHILEMVLSSITKKGEIESI